MITREYIESLLRELSPSVSIGKVLPKAKDGIRDNALFVDISTSPPRLFVWNANRWQRIGSEAGDVHIGSTEPITVTNNGGSSVVGLSFNPSHFSVINGQLTLDTVLTNNPTFDTLRVLNLSDGYIPYHINDTVGFGNSPLLVSNGNVGINVSNPTTTLQVGGIVSANKLYINSTTDPSGDDWQQYINGNVGINGSLLFYNANGSYRLYTDTAHILTMRNYGTAYTIAQLWSVGDLQNGNTESTLALLRSDANQTNSEFVDIYSNGYTGVDVSHGIRIQKRGSGQYRPFLINKYDGTTLTQIVAVDTVSDRVGILTTNPSTTLDVNGDAHISGNLSVDVQATASNHVVTGGRIISTTAPLTGGGDLTANRTLSLSYNTTNLKLTSNALNTIQDIATTSTPTFSQLLLTNQATTTSQAVRADRTISTNAPLTGGGNLTANRTLSLSYNTTNLKLTSNALNTIQDIATTSTPTFNNIKITDSNVAKDYLLSLNSATNSLKSSIVIAGGNFIRVKGSIYGNANKAYGGQLTKDALLQDFIVLPNGFLNYYTNFRFEQDQLRFANRRPDKFTITYSGGFTSNDIDRLFSQYASLVNLYGKSEGCWIQVECSAGTIGDAPAGTYVLLHSDNNPVTVKIEHKYSTNPNAWVTIYEGTSTTLAGAYTTSHSYVIGIRWTFTKILNPTYIRWIGHLVMRMTGYRHTVMRYGDDMYGNLSMYADIKMLGSGNIRYIGTTDNSPFQIRQNNTNVLHIDTAKNVGISTTTPAYKLDVAGTGRFTQDLRLDTILNQQGTSGLNIFKADINQQGNKSIYNNFISGWTGSGWRIDYGITNPSRTHLELDDLTVRGTMRVYELIINQIRATNGSLFVSSSARAETVTRVTGNPVTYTIVFEDPEGNNLCPFAVNDIVIVQRVRLDSITVVKLIVLQVTTVTGKQITGSVIYESGQITKGDLVVRIGNTINTARQGSVYLTSDDSNAPYIDVVDGVNSWSAWNATDKIKVRLGQLAGVSDSFFGNLSGYGLYAKSNAYLRGKIYAEAGGWIAGWTINSTDLSSPLIASNHQLQLIADNSNLIIGAYLDINKGGANPLYLSFGKVKTFDGTYASSYGLSAKDESGKDYFELSNGRKHIANWDFDNDKFYKGTDIELNAVNKSVGVNSNKVKMFYSDANNWGILGLDVNSNTVFKLGSENEIAGWKFDSNYLWKLGDGSPSSSPSRGLVLNSTTGSIGVYGSTWHRAVYMFYSDDNNWGIKGYKNDTSLIPVFELGSKNQIAGWSFDDSKLYKSTVSLEASSSMKGLVVNNDIIRIGEFNSATLTNTMQNNTITFLNYNGIVAGDNAWALDTAETTVETEGSRSEVILTVNNNSLYHYAYDTDTGARPSDVYRLICQSFHNLYGAVTKLVGRTSKIEVKYKVHKYTAGSYHNLYIYMYLLYFSSGWGRLRYVYLDNVSVNEASVTVGTPYVIDRTGSNAITFNVPYHPDAANIYLVFRAGFEEGSGRRAMDFEVTDLTISNYLGAKTQINQDGFEIFNSNDNYIRFRENSLEINSGNLKVNGRVPMVFLGRSAVAPSEAKLGDVYYNTSNNTLYMCYGYNWASPLWQAI